MSCSRTGGGPAGAAPKRAHLHNGRGRRRQQARSTTSYSRAWESRRSDIEAHVQKRHAGSTGSRGRPEAHGPGTTCPRPRQSPSAKVVARSGAARRGGGPVVESDGGGGVMGEG
eukprot:7385936-Alexandrium_andersonii.AAC.1